MFGLGSTELLIILLLVVVFFGAKRLPEIGRSLGRLGSEYREGKSSAGAKAEKDGGGSGGPEPDRENDQDQGLDIEAEIKNRIVSRIPGMGQINRIKKTAEMVDRVARAAEKSGGSDSGPKQGS